MKRVSCWRLGVRSRLLLACATVCVLALTFVYLQGLHGSPTQYSCVPATQPACFHVHEHQAQNVAPAPRILRVGVVGLWASAADVLSELWVLQCAARDGLNATLVPEDDLWRADVLLVGAYNSNRAAVVDVIATHRVHAVTMFLASENTELPEYSAYHDQLLGVVDISLGHRVDSIGPTYHRMPWWLPYTLLQSAGCGIPAVLTAPCASDPAAWRRRRYHAAMLTKHDKFPRPEMITAFGTAGHGPVHAPGRAFTNMRWPSECYPDSHTDMRGKIAFFNDFRFNLCPENSRTADGGYATEKLVQAHLAGNVPVYWGDVAAGVDTEFWNPARIIIVNSSRPGAESDDEMVAAVAVAARLESDAQYRADWFAQPVLQPAADMWLQRWFQRLSSMWAAAAAAKRTATFTAVPPLVGSAVHVLSFATAANDAFRASSVPLRLHGYRQVVVGAELTSWSRNWTQRSEAYVVALQALIQQHGELALVVAADAFDTMAMCDAAAFATRFLAFQSPIVVGSDAFCFGNCDAGAIGAWWKQARENGWAPSASHTIRNRFMDAGLLAGSAAALLHLYRWGMRAYPPDDQVALGRFAAVHPQLVRVDTGRKLFWNVGFGAPPPDDATLQGRGACFVHFPLRSFPNGVNDALFRFAAEVAVSSGTARQEAHWRQGELVRGLHTQQISAQVWSIATITLPALFVLGLALIAWRRYCRDAGRLPKP